MFSKSTPIIGDSQRITLFPSKYDSISLYCFKSLVKETKAPFCVCRLTLLFSFIGPVVQSPAGITTTPPPDLEHFSIAELIAFVQSCSVLGIAPKSTIFKVSLLNFGICTSGILKGIFRLDLAFLSDAFTVPFFCPIHEKTAKRNAVIRSVLLVFIITHCNFDILFFV
ncbi:hypothetical protein D3C80_1554960 [compost metagenome]